MASFLTFALVTASGHDLLHTNAIKMAIVLVYTIFSVILFLSHGIIEFRSGLLLTAGNVVGAYIGTRIAIKRGNKFLRIALFVMLMVSAVKMLFDVLKTVY